MNYKTMQKPLISVIMPVYNAEKYVGEAIESILNQTFTDFEFLIFNDGSKDKSAEIVHSYAEKDGRIVFYNYQENRGLIAILNEGVERAQGKYIARMDADDISLPERFEKQVEYMEGNEEVILLGTGYQAFGSQIDFIWKPETENDKLKIELLNQSAFAHPTVFIRKKILSKNKLVYDATFYPAEDYALWIKLSYFGKIANLEDILLKYRVHDNQISQNKSSIQRNHAYRLKKNQLIQLGLPSEILTENTIMTLFPLPWECQKQIFPTNKIIAYASILNLMWKLNLKNKLYCLPILQSFLLDKWIAMTVLGIENYNISLWITYYKLPFPTFALHSFKENYVFTVKCLLFWKTRL